MFNFLAKLLLAKGPAGFEWKRGILPAGGEIHAGIYTLDGAKSFCEEYKGNDGPCLGFTFQGMEKDLTSPSKVYFKNVIRYHGPHPINWNTYARPNSWPVRNFTELPGDQNASEWLIPEKSKSFEWKYAPKEKGLSYVLEWTAQRMLNETLHRVKSKECRDKVKHMATEGMANWERTFDRHPFAELHCPLDYMQGVQTHQKENGEQVCPKYTRFRK